MRELRMKGWNIQEEINGKFMEWKIIFSFIFSEGLKTKLKFLTAKIII